MCLKVLVKFYYGNLNNVQLGFFYYQENKMHLFKCSHLNFEETKQLRNLDTILGSRYTKKRNKKRFFKKKIFIRLTVNFFILFFLKKIE